jgi:integrase
VVGRGFINRNKTAALRAEAKRRTDLQERRAGFTKLKQAPKFEKFIDQFLEWSGQQHKLKTHALHKWNYGTLKRLFGGNYLDEITAEMVENFKAARKQERRQKAKDARLVSGTTVNRALETLKAMFYQAVRMGYFVKNPVVGVAMFKRPLDSMRVISFEEQGSYINQASHLLRDIAEVMLDTGMRPEEVFRIKIENVDFSQKTIFNPFGKTKAARRSVPMTENVCSILKRRIKDASQRASPYVFPSPLNAQRPVGSVKRAHRAAAERAKIKGHFRLYDLRHTFATRTAAVGMSLPTLAAILGHTTIQMTMRYVHPAAEEKRLGMNKFEQFRAEGIMNAAMASGSRGSLQKSLHWSRYNDGSPSC